MFFLPNFGKYYATRFLSNQRKTRTSFLFDAPLSIFPKVFVLQADNRTKERNDFRINKKIEKGVLEVGKSMFGIVKTDLFKSPARMPGKTLE